MSLRQVSRLRRWLANCVVLCRLTICGGRRGGRSEVCANNVSDGRSGGAPPQSALRPRALAPGAHQPAALLLCMRLGLLERPVKQQLPRRLKHGRQAGAACAACARTRAAAAAARAARAAGLGAARQGR